MALFGRNKPPQGGGESDSISTRRAGISSARIEKAFGKEVEKNYDELYKKFGAKTNELFTELCRLNESSSKAAQKVSTNCASNAELLLKKDIDPAFISNYTDSVGYLQGYFEKNIKKGDNSATKGLEFVFLNQIFGGAAELISAGVDRAHLTNPILLIVETMLPGFEKIEAKLRKEGIIADLANTNSTTHILYVYLDKVVSKLKEDPGAEFGPWVEKGVEYAESYIRKGDPFAIVDYFSGASSVSIDVLKQTIELREINFIEVQPMLFTYVNMTTGGTIRKVETYDNVPGAPRVPHVYNGEIYLQPKEDAFPEREQNKNAFICTAGHEAFHPRYESDKINVSKIDASPLSLKPEDIEALKNLKLKPEGTGQSKILVESIFGLLKGKEHKDTIEFDSFRELFLKLFGKNAEFGKYLWNVIEDGRIDWRGDQDYPGFAVRRKPNLEADLKRRPPFINNPLQDVIEAFLQLTVCGKTRQPMSSELEAIVMPLYQISKSLQTKTTDATDSLNATIKVYVQLKKMFKDLPNPSTLPRTFTHMHDHPDENTVFFDPSDEEQKPQKGKGKGKQGEGKEGEKGDDSEEADGGGKGKKEKGKDSKEASGEGDKKEKEDKLGNGAPKFKFTGSNKKKPYKQRSDEDSAPEAKRKFVAQEWNPENRKFSEVGEVIEQRLSPTKSKRAEKLRDVIIAVREVFRRLQRPTVKRVSKQYYGETLDIRRYTQYALDIQTGKPGDSRFWSTKKRVPKRDVVVFLLFDVSGSTSGKVISVENDVCTVFTEALTEIGDKCGIYAYDEGWNGNLNFYVAKEPDDPHFNTELMAGGCTPTGPALRHLVRRASEYPAKRKIIILVTDGMPNALGRGIHTHVWADVRAAFGEAWSRGITAFAINVLERGAEKYEPAFDAMYDKYHVEIGSIRDLLSVLSRIYFNFLGRV
ncbi:MAG: hypothetical protein ABIH99_00500 [Candidatus Micrarchaeota archaeon]